MQLLLDTEPDAKGTPQARTDRKPRSARKQPIVCAACRAQVADGEHRIEVDGHHEHTFFNPAGVVYRVTCFASAPGCRGVGPFSAEFSWFPGHRWQIGVCASCQRHLGWHFDGDSAFSALIASHIDQE